MKKVNPKTINPTIRPAKPLKPLKPEKPVKPTK
jgi:hypothetical protein